jgi:sec-independent protein translocase protein TatC
MFQFPIAIYLLVKTGIIELSLLKKQRSTIMIIILVLSAILTPTPDIMTMLIMALPTYLLFEISLFLTGFSTQRSEIKNKLLDNIELAPPDSSSSQKKRQRKIHSLQRK